MSGKDLAYANNLAFFWAFCKNEAINNKKVTFNSHKINMLVLFL